MEAYLEVSEVYSAYQTVLSEYNRKVELMLSVACNPQSCADELRAISAEVSQVAAQLSQLRAIISSHFERLSTGLSA
ncbi:MAG TPA: hypothetical protein VFG50_12615 [Rhodothermales bacterium]|nr:hypothetical protein [Rhodothermales bacterium]